MPSSSKHPSCTVSHTAPSPPALSGTVLGWRNSLEQAGNSINHAGNKAVVVPWSLGELGGEFLF